MILNFKDEFRIRIGADPPVDVPPMEIKFEKEERPVNLRQSTYPGAARFHEQEMRRTSGSGIHIRQPFLIVPKEGPEKFRFTVYLRPVNTQTKKKM